jgi:hypothetical protein
METEPFPGPDRKADAMETEPFPDPDRPVDALKCPYCFKTHANGRRFASSCEVDKHVAEERHGGWEPRCDFCNKHFKCYDSLHAHLNIAIPNSKACVPLSAVAMSYHRSGCRRSARTGTKKLAARYALLYPSPTQMCQAI